MVVACIWENCLLQEVDLFLQDDDLMLAVANAVIHDAEQTFEALDGITLLVDSNKQRPHVGVKSTGTQVLLDLYEECNEFLSTHVALTRARGTQGGGGHIHVVCHCVAGHMLLGEWCEYEGVEAKRNVDKCKCGRWMERRERVGVQITRNCGGLRRNGAKFELKGSF